MTGDFIELLKRLVKAGVDFVIVGGFAGSVYGSTMVTQDIDICLDSSTANLLALQKSMADVHLVHRMTPERQKHVLTEKNCTNFKNLHLDTDIGRLDCLGAIKGIGNYQKVREANITVKTEGFDCQCSILTR